MMMMMRIDAKSTYEGSVFLYVSVPLCRRSIKCDYSNSSHYLNINYLGALHADKHVYSIGSHTWRAFCKWRMIYYNIIFLSHCVNCKSGLFEPLPWEGHI